MPIPFPALFVISILDSGERFDRVVGGAFVAQGIDFEAGLSLVRTG
jgi:hypothetical protein